MHLLRFTFNEEQRNIGEDASNVSSERILRKNTPKARNPSHRLRAFSVLIQ